MRPTAHSELHAAGQHSVDGAAESDDGVVRLTPLATWALQIQLEQAGVEVPVLPPVQQMTAADLVALADGGSEQEVTAEMTAWLELRGAEAAADELLQAAATGSAADRLFATALAAWIGAAAEPQWRQALNDPPTHDNDLRMNKVRSTVPGPAVHSAATAVP